MGKILRRRTETGYEAVSLDDPSGREGWKITSNGKEKPDMTTKMLEKNLSKENLEKANVK